MLQGGDAHHSSNGSPCPSFNRSRRTPRTTRGYQSGLTSHEGPGAGWAKTRLTDLPHAPNGTGTRKHHAHSPGWSPPLAHSALGVPCRWEARGPTSACRSRYHRKRHRGRAQSGFTRDPRGLQGLNRYSVCRQQRKSFGWHARRVAPAAALFSCDLAVPVWYSSGKYRGFPDESRARVHHGSSTAACPDSCTAAGGPTKRLKGPAQVTCRARRSRHRPSRT